jgi:hypothetical protein
VTREELEHAIRATCEIAGDVEVYVFGSQAILGQFPDAPATLRQSAEADIMPKNRPDRVDAVDGALGLDSQFHQTHGFYVHGVSIEAATLAPAWERRVKVIRNENTRGYTGLCLEGHDLAVSKLVAYREKDLEFVRVLLQHRMVHPNRLVRLINILPVEEEHRVRLRQWVDRTVRDLSSRT